MVEATAVREITQQVFEIVLESGETVVQGHPLSFEELAMIGGGHATVNTI